MEDPPETLWPQHAAVSPRAHMSVSMGFALRHWRSPALHTPQAYRLAARSHFRSDGLTARGMYLVVERSSDGLPTMPLLQYPCSAIDERASCTALLANRHGGHVSVRRLLAAGPQILTRSDATRPGLDTGDVVALYAEVSLLVLYQI